MPWVEMSKRHFQRQLGENETFIKMIGDTGERIEREHWAINVDACLSLPFQHNFPEHWESAWETLRFQHPSIATVASSTHIGYTVPDVQALKRWSTETFIIKKGKCRADIAANHRPGPFVILHVFPDEGDLLLHTSHWRTDGVGALQLLNAFLDLVACDTLPDPASLPWGEEVVRLAPSVEEAANMPKEPDENIRAEAEKWTKTFDAAADAVHIQCTADLGVVPQATRYIRANFSKFVTESIVQACKPFDISVTAAVQAALAMTNWEFAAPEEQSKHYTTTIRSSLRPYLPEPYNTPAYASGLYTSGYLHKIPPGKSFYQSSRELSDLYRKGLSSGFLKAHRQYVLNHLDLIRRPPSNPRPTSNVDISGLGLIDNIVRPVYGTLEVLGVNAGVEILSRQMTLVVWTFRGELGFNLVYNEAFYDAEVPDRFLKRLMGTLLEEVSRLDEFE